MQNRFGSKSLFFKWLFMTCHRQYIMHQLMLCSVQLMQVCPKSWAIRTPNFLYLPTSTYSPLHSYSHLFTYRACLGLHPCHWRTVKEQQHGSCIFQKPRTNRIVCTCCLSKARSMFAAQLSHSQKCRTFQCEVYVHLHVHAVYIYICIYIYIYVYIYICAYMHRHARTHLIHIYIVLHKYLTQSPELPLFFLD